MNASLVKELKDMTGAGLMDCKKALEASNGNIDEAVQYLREKGISKAAKKADRVAVEGSSKIVIDGNNAVIFEVNCETDFVAENKNFKDLLEKIGSVLIKSDVTSLEDALKLETEDGTLNDTIINITATMGEKISLRRFERITKSDNEVFGDYSHMGGKISVLTLLEGASAEIAKDVSMHAAAMRPSYVNKDEVPTEEVEKETEILKTQAMNEGKPAEIAEKMVKGRINKYFKEICLEDQDFVKNSDMTVKAYVESNNGKILKMVRYEVGEGMEKKEENFAEEVMKQIKGN